MSNIIVIDTETTGLGKEPGRDEVLSLAIIDGSGCVLFSDFIRPSHRKRWPKAQEVNGITWDDVKDKKTLAELEDYLRPIFDGASGIIGYNLPFDIKMLKESGFDVGDANTFDVMREYADRWNNGRWISLSKCAASFGYKFTPHNALEDVRATLFCYQQLIGGAEPYSGKPPIVLAPSTDSNEDAPQGKKQDTALGKAATIIAGCVLLCLGVFLVMNGGFLGFLLGVLLAIVGFIILVIGFAL